MPPLNLGFDTRADVDTGYQEFVFDDGQEFEDIRRYSLSNNPSSPSIQTQLSRNPSSPISQEMLSSNSSSPMITGRISTNTSSPTVSNTEIRGSLEMNQGEEIYENEYGGTYVPTYEDYKGLTPGTVTLGLNEEEEGWRIQSLTLPEEMHEGEIEEAFESIQEIIEKLEDEIEVKKLDEEITDQRSES